jgi:hypothetical protein
MYFLCKFYAYFFNNIPSHRIEGLGEGTLGPMRGDKGLREGDKGSQRGERGSDEGDLGSKGLGEQEQQHAQPLRCMWINNRIWYIKNLDTFIYIDMCIYIYLHTYIHIYIYIYLYIYKDIYVYIYLYEYMHVCSPICKLSPWHCKCLSACKYELKIFICVLIPLYIRILMNVNFWIYSFFYRYDDHNCCHHNHDHHNVNYSDNGIHHTIKLIIWLFSIAEERHVIGTEHSQTSPYVQGDFKQIQNTEGKYIAHVSIYFEMYTYS